MQSAAAEATIGDEPTLVILEDPTGSGKTEAALILAHRMIQHGLGEGIYIALPTTATANAMYDRLSSVYRRLFAADAHPSLALAHGRRKFSQNFRQAVQFAKKQVNADRLSSSGGSRESEAETVEASCAE